jgi:hemerythrin-like domain-containing protein
MFRHEALRPLSRQHHNGLALVVLAGRGLDKRGDRAVADWCARAVERFDGELANHFKAEEAVLFPAIREALGEVALVGELIGEHREMERLAGELRRNASRETLEGFLQLLRGHIRREENELFEMIQERMSAASLQALAEPLAAKVAELCLTVEREEPEES